ncbi:MtrAB system histidine kinase MtrB [Antricoccus suffuscus]|uniref:MtrAB system histidine kinase MtrB n=1 Tax=Antricoccus suffuscus TaxID=1629062 RepID=UPI000D05F2AE|nr:MtrAB system histidine kinase MtrB [Antricoccus suffuscus]
MAVVQTKLATLGQWMLQRWRRSLQVRIVALTMVITFAVIAVVGYILITQIGAGLLAAKQRAAIEKSTSGVRYMQNQLQLVGSSSAQSVSDALSSGTSYLSQGASSAGIFEVITLVRGDKGTTPRVYSPSLHLDVLPADLQTTVQGGKQAWSIATVPYAGEKQSVLVVGSTIPSVLGDFEIYFVYPLENENQIISFVQQTVLLAGLALMLLIAGVGLLISRLVVLPVREVAQTAGELAEGNLDRRMIVKGEDDLAKLASSFNDMAASLSSQIVRLENLSQVQQRFTSDVSHELRTPLTTVRMAAELLYDYRADFPEVASRSAELLYTELDRFEALLKDLLEISRYDAGGLSLDAEHDDMASLVRRVFDAHRTLAREQGCEMHLEVPDEPIVVVMNSSRIARVLRNLIANALEHGAGDPVEVTVATNETAVAVTVRDHGVGIDETAAEHLFDRFWRADPSRVRKLGGTGLGMAISVEDIRLHDGWLQVWGRPSGGANFRITLPLASSNGVIMESPLSLVPPGESGGAFGGHPTVRRSYLRRQGEGTT